MSYVVFRDAHYVVSVMTKGDKPVSIIVQSTKKQKGKLMLLSHRQFKGYLEGFAGDGDNAEKHALAKAMFI